MCLCDLKNDGDQKFVIADLLHNFNDKNKGHNKSANPRKLKVYMGTNTIFEHTIQDKPVALTTIFDQYNKPNLPVIAVASGSTIYYFKDFSLDMRFELPLIEFSYEESEIWS